MFGVHTGYESSGYYVFFSAMLATRRKHKRKHCIILIYLLNIFYPYLNISYSFTLHLSNSSVYLTLVDRAYQFSINIYQNSVATHRHRFSSYFVFRYLLVNKVKCLLWGPVAMVTETKDWKMAVLSYFEDKLQLIAAVPVKQIKMIR